MYRKLLFLTIIIVGIFFAIAVFAQTCPHIYEGINCGANWYCNGCQTTCKSCPGGGDPTGATELNYVSCTCGCPSGQIVCSNACVTAPACSTPTREQNNSSCNGCGACKSGYAADPANPNPPSPCLKAAYIDYPNTGYFQTSGDLKSTGGDLYLASGKAIRIDGAGTTILSVANSVGTALDVVLKGGLLVYDTMTSPSQGPGSINAEKLCIQGNCRTTWPEAVSAFVDEGNVGFGPTAVLGTNDNTPLSFEVNNIGRIYIDTAGNVGIGTTAPTYNLVVNGASPREYIWSTSGNPELDLGDGTNHWSIYRDTATDQLRFWRTNDRMAITSSGNVGLGTISPASKLSILGNLAVGAAYVGLVGPGDGAIIQGNVGIGTSSPAYKLDVAGQANANQLCIAGDCRGVWPGATPPGGSDTQVQFNDGGSFGGSWGLAYDKTSSALSVGGPLMVGGTIGVNGLGANPNVGIQSRGSASGGYFASSVASGYALLGQGDYGVNAYGNSSGLYGSGGTYGVYGNGSSYGVYGSSNNTGVYGYGSVYGIYGTTSFAAADAGYFYNTLSGTYARLGWSTWAGYFGGNTYASGNETIVGTSTIGSNLRIGSNSSADDDYIFFDDGTADHYIQWYNTGGEFRFSHPIFSYGWLSGTQLTVRSGGYNQAVDDSNTKSIVMRHMGSYGLLETQSASADAGNLMLRSDTDYPANYVDISDEVRIGSTLTVVGNATVSGQNVCLQNGVNCPASGGTIGGSGTANYLAKFTAGSTIGNSQIYDNGTNVGIGTAAPSAKLDINGNLKIGTLSGVLWASSGTVSGLATTSNLPEGSNLYYTDTRARNALSSGAGPVNYTPSTGVISFSGPLVTVYGGTGGTATPTAGAVAYGTGTAYAFTTAGSSGQFLQSNGVGSPSWTSSLNASNLTSGTVAIARGGTGLSSTPAAGQLLIGTGAAYNLANLTGTANRVIVTNGSGSITLSAPQDIATTSSPTFAATTLSGNLSADSNTRGTCSYHSVSGLAASYYDLLCPDGKFLAGLSFSAASGGYVDEIYCCEL